MTLAVLCAATGLAAQESTMALRLPPGLEAELRSGLSPHTRARLDAEVRRALAAAPTSSSQVDVVVQFLDAEGHVMRPDLERAPRAGERVSTPTLTFTFDSPTDPWTAQEEAQLRTALQVFYGEIQSIIGPPAFSNVVNIIKDSKTSYAGWYSSASNTIALKSSTPLKVLCHELVHAFRDDCIMGPDTFEEGLARGVEVEVLGRHKDYQHPGDLHDYIYDVHYELLNQPALGGKNGSFWLGYRSPHLRYQLTGYAWGKVLIEWPTALEAFHRELYRRAASNPSLLFSESALSRLAGECIPSVEGRSFPEWYAAQPILNPAPPVGEFLTVNPSQMCLDLFRRDPSGTETMYGGIPITWNLRDAQGRILAQGTEATSPLGWIMPSLYNISYKGRTTLQGTATTPSGTVLQASASYCMGIPYFGYFGRLGIFGIATEADGGTVRITPLDRPQEAVTVPLQDGAFSAPSLAKVRGRFRVELQAGERRFEKQLTKDAADYYVCLGLAVPVGPAPSLDLNGDGLVDVLDLVPFMAALASGSPASGSPADLNRDGVVDDADLTLLLARIRQGMS